MALDSGRKETEIKAQFTTREGIYKQMPNSEYCRPNRVPHTTQGPPSTSTPVKASFAEVNGHDGTHTRIVFTIGRDLFYFNYEGVSQPVDLNKPLDKRTYKGAAPTCHHVNGHTSSPESVRIAVGFAAGQVQIIDVGTKQSLQILNEERMTEKSPVTCVKWLPQSESILISSHSNGHMYTYDSTQENVNVIPQYHERPYKMCGSIAIYTLKNKTYPTSTNGQTLGVVLKNPLHKWAVTANSSAIHEFEFSPDARHLAIVSQDGYLRVVEYGTFEAKGFMKSYFGGLLCCCWSPDGRYIVTGGEDDLITVWSFHGSYVLARGHGHRSWVSNVCFDSYCCNIPSIEEIGKSCGVDLSCVATEGRRQQIDEGSKSSKDNKKSPGSKIQESSPLIINKSVISRHYIQDTDHNKGRSITSKISRISLAADSADPAKQFFYRFGSVGQDAQLCLWELTEDILFPKRRTATLLEGLSSVHGEDRGDCNPLRNNFAHINGLYVPHEHSAIDEINPVHESELADAKGKHSKSSNISNSNSPMKEHGSHKGLHFFSLSKDFFKSESSTTTSQGPTGEKFATLGSRDIGQRKEGTKEHKRNLSLPYFGSKNSSHAHNSVNGMSKSNHHKHNQEFKTLGTVLCPRLNETTMLEPLVCKRITQGRLTCISFQKDSIVTACQDGFIQTWARPVMLMPNSRPRSPNLVANTHPNMSSPVNKSGTVV